MRGNHSLKKMAFHAAIGTTVFCLLLLPGITPTAMGAMTPAEESAELSIEEKEKLVTRGVTQYEKGDIEAAEETLLRAKAIFPSNYAVPYYLGLIYLEKNRRSEAIAEWQQYVLMDPKSKESLKIRKYLTLLVREDAVTYAKEAVANEAALLDGPVTDNTLAITTFINMGSESLGPLGKGLTAMLINDLSKAPDLQVVERIKLQALLEEMNLGTSGVVNPETVPRVGKLLKSKHVATGSFLDPEEESLHIFSALVDTEQADQIDTRETQGALSDFFDLEKRIACGIIEDLGRNCNDMPGSFNKIHTKSLAALTSFSKGLDYLDQEKYDEAREQFQKAVDEDPEFDLAKETLALTPFATMLLLTSSQMTSSLSSSAASSGTIGATTAGTAASTGGGVGAVGITSSVVAGAAGLAGLASVADDDDDDNDTDNTPVLDLTGNWSGTWTDSNGGTGNIILDLEQTGTTVSGTADVIGHDCSFSGNITGSVDGNSFQANISGDASASFNTTCTDTDMNGTLEITSGGCAGHSGTVSTSIVGSAIIRW